MRHHRSPHSPITSTPLRPRDHQVARRELGLSMLALATALTACGPVDSELDPEPDPERLEETDDATDVTRLLELSEDLERRAQLERDRAYELASAADLPIRGPGYELVGLRDDGLPAYYTTHNLVAAQSVKTDKVWPGGGLGIPAGLTGLGRVIGIWDGGGVRTSHQELSGRVTQMDSPAGTDDHATHVAGTLIANGISASAIGMAFEADLEAYDWSSDASEMAAAAAGGLRISNHSYGHYAGWDLKSSGDWYWYGDTDISTTEDWLFGFYDSVAETWDEIAYDAPMYLIVKSAGNDRNDTGPSPGATHYYQDPTTGAWTQSTATRDPDGGALGFDTIPSFGNAKNILTVGSVEDIPGGYSVPADVSLSSFSGWGPTDDGRIKPDLVANGEGLTSTLASSDTAYGSYSGTSMSSPSVAGSLALLQQHFTQVFGYAARSSMIKAIAIHTADEAGPFTGPDYKHGWGLLNMAHAVTLVSQASSGSSTLVFDSLDDVEDQDAFAVTITDDRNLVVTLCWTDPAGTASTASLDPTANKLVNDLDVRVVRVHDGQTFRPWVMRPWMPGAAPIVGDNDIDNVEQVLVELPSPGLYQVIVEYEGSLTNGVQDYSLVISQQQT